MASTAQAPTHPDRTLRSRLHWLRAAILGANDGLVSTASLISGMAAGADTKSAVLLAGMAGLVAGAMSMAAGEFVSVSSQSDAEQAQIDAELAVLAADPKGEESELADIYRDRGLEPATAAAVARQLTEKDAVTAHLVDELHIDEVTRAKPIEAAAASALSFIVGAAPPLAIAAIMPHGAKTVVAVSVTTVVMLAVLGWSGAKLGGAPAMKGTVRVVVWGALALGVTTVIGNLFGAVT